MEVIKENTIRNSRNLNLLCRQVVKKIKWWESIVLHKKSKELEGFSALFFFKNDEFYLLILLKFKV